MIVRYMYNKAVYKINHIICDIMTFFILMIIVEPADSLWFFIVFCDSIFSHGRSTYIANEVVYAALNVGIIIWFRFGIDIESFRMVFIESVLFFRFLQSTSFLYESNEFKLKSFSKLSKIEMIKCFDFILFKGIDQFRNKAMDVWIPF